MKRGRGAEWPQGDKFQLSPLFFFSKKSSQTPTKETNRSSRNLITNQTKLLIKTSSQKNNHNNKSKMTWTTDFFGPELVTKGGKVSTESALAGKKVIAIYFSAHWVSIH
jgi:hypothetical protein